MPINKFWGPVILTLVLVAGCSSPASPAATPAPASSAKALTAFVLANPAATGTITGTAVAVTVPFGTAVSSLVATFTTTGTSVKVGGRDQVSGTTANDFTSPVAYLVTAADGSTATFTVTVTVATNTAKALTGFSFQSPAATGTITGTAVAVTVPFGTAVSPLVATFTTTGTSVKVGGKDQVSGTTANDFTSPVAYLVTAADGSTATFTVTVTVTVALNTAKALTSFALVTPAVGGTINEAAKTVAVGFPALTVFAPSSLVATFASTGASVTVGGVTQVSGTTVNNFTTPVSYVVTAADGSTASYAVSVTQNAGGAVSTGAGSATAGASNGTGTSATFSSPIGLVSDGTNLYVADYSNNDIRKIVIATEVVTTLAGSPTHSALVDGTGTAAQFCGPAGVVTDGTNLYVADQGNEAIRKIVIATGVVTTLAGSGSVGSANGVGAAASFNNPYFLAIAGTSLFVSDYSNKMIRQIDLSSGTVTTLAGSTTSGYVDAAGVAARFNGPTGLATDGVNLYVGDFGNNMIRKIVIATGVVTTLAGSTSSGYVDSTGTSARFHGPGGIATDGVALYVSDSSNNTIRKIVIATGTVTTFAGSTTAGFSDGLGVAASFNGAFGVTIAASDSTRLFVSDTGNNAIRMIQ